MPFEDIYNLKITTQHKLLPQRHGDTERFKESLIHTILFIFVIQPLLLFYYNMIVESNILLALFNSTNSNKKSAIPLLSVPLWQTKLSSYTQSLQPGFFPFAFASSYNLFASGSFSFSCFIRVSSEG